MSLAEEIIELKQTQEEWGETYEWDKITLGSSPDSNQDMIAELHSQSMLKFPNWFFKSVTVVPKNLQPEEFVEIVKEKIALGEE